MRTVLAELDGMATAVRAPEGDWSGRDLLERAAGAAQALSTAGPPGRAVPALLSSSADSIALVLGGAFSGHPIAPLGPRLKVPELVPLIEALQASVLVTDRANVALAEATATAAGVALTVVDGVPAVTPDFAPIEPDSIVLVLHTSGTTGQPKAVAVRDAAVFARSRCYHSEMGLTQGDLYCSTGGFHHTGGAGMLFVALACGAGVVPMPRFSVDAWRSLAALKPSCALIVPTMIDMLLEEGALADVALRAIHYGTAPIHPETLRAALAAVPGTTFTQAYGMTEGGPISMLNHADHLRALAGEPELLASVGRPSASVEVRFDDVGPDGVGEIVVRAGQIFQPGPDGWLHTGDLGRLDDGFLFLEGRRGDTIIRGGENVYPLEVERVLERHDQVREAAVIGVDSRRWGQTIKAFVVAADGDDPPSVAELADHVRGNLAGFKVPAEWEFIAALPRNAAGKLLRAPLM